MSLQVVRARGRRPLPGHLTTASDHHRRGQSAAAKLHTPTDQSHSFLETRPGAFLQDVVDQTTVALEQPALQSVTETGFCKTAGLTYETVRNVKHRGTQLPQFERLAERVW
jgi:hypothetical protein